MRLIDASTLKLVSKRDDELPPYAILSHTWGNDEDEVSFEDMQSFGMSTVRSALLTHVVSRKVGFAKIRQSARLALSQGLQYIWVDTCCINKGSSAELSEAINSMFRWYQSSAVCYALLSDVSVDASDAGMEMLWNGIPVPAYDKCSQAIRSSRWFTRGWTLQELIASRNVQFYFQDWTFLADKNDYTGFQGLIGSITGIPIAILNGSRSLDTLGIAERMSWASSRQTTRIEDQAYSLMGIFDINMPLLYGEGKRAFIRLQQEILKASNDQSLFAWTTNKEEFEPSSTLTGLLAPSPACFKNTGHIVPLPPDSSSASAPSAMTNIGLQITLELAPASVSEPGEFNAILDCASYTSGDMHSSQTSRAAIRLEALGGNQYARVQSHCIFDLPTLDTNKLSYERYRQIYVKQQPVPLMPDVSIRGLENIHAHGGRLIAVWPHGQWDAAKRVVRPRGAPRDGIIAAFRFKFDSQPDTYAPESEDDLDTLTLDIFVGHSPTSGNSTYATASQWCSSFISSEDLPLPNVVSAAPTHILGSYRSTSCKYDVDSRPSIVFTVSRDYGKGQAMLSLSITMIHELSAAALDPIPASFDNPMVEKYEHVSQRMIVEDAASVSLSNVYSSIYGIRVGRKDGSSPCQAELDRLRHCVSSSTINLVLLKPDQTTPDVFETYFSKLLVKACISNDLRGARELVKSRLSTALANVWTSEVHTRFQDFDQLSLLKGFRPLHWAALFGYEELAWILLDHGADPFLDNWIGLTPIHVAIVMGHVKVLDRIFASDSNTKRSAFEKLAICDTLPNFAVSFIGTEEVITVLRSLSTTLESDGLDSPFGKPNALGETFLHRAAATNNIYAARWAIEWNVELVNSRDKRGRTPLFHAAAANSVEICRILLDNGAGVDAADNFGRTPLCAACRHGHHQIAELLLVADSSPNALSLDNGSSLKFTAWHFATLSGNPEVVRILGKYAMGIGVTDMGLERLVIDCYNVINPLHIASSFGSLECVEALCDAGFSSIAKTTFAFVPETINNAKPLIETGEPKTAEEWAKVRGYDEIATILHAVKVA